MTLEYVDAGKAFNHSKLSNLPHSAPDVTRGDQLRSHPPGAQ